MKVRKFMELLQHEFTRPRNANIMTDVFDSPEWVKLMGPPTFPCERIGIQLCSDGFPLFDCGSLSLTPVMLKMLSLPPGIRSKPEFMSLLLLLPTNVKNISQKKYYDFAAIYEMNHLFSEGFFFFISYITTARSLT